MGPISVAARRGETVESRHRVHGVAVRDGEVLHAAGNPALVTFLRSAAKPFQALPLVRARGGLPDDGLAVACASHQAEPAQLEAVRSLLALAGASEDELECGLQEGRPPARLYHNCSGKHAGMLVLCRARGWPLEGYSAAGHPCQQAMQGEIAAAAGLPPSRIPAGVDGCGVPTFVLTLRRMAAAFARLPALDGAERVLAAMRSRPDLVGGEGALDTALMQALPGWVAKRGAEGVLCATDCEGLGLALKVEDGNPRALRPALQAFLSPLGLEVDEDLGYAPVLNSRGEVVGEVVVA